MPATFGEFSYFSIKNLKIISNKQTYVHTLAFISFIDYKRQKGEKRRKKIIIKFGTIFMSKRKKKERNGRMDENHCYFVNFVIKTILFYDLLDHVFTQQKQTNV